MKKVIFDCDNTMGVQGCDVDDGLALLYLLGKETIEICGITTTYGNSNLQTVYDNTTRILTDIDRLDIPVLKGCPGPQIFDSEAARFIVETAAENQGRISILATGSLTNLYEAYLLDQTIFDKIAEIVLMGGITEPLIINGHKLDELNFSCDPVASACVLQHGKNVSVITGNNCLQAFFAQEEFNQRLNSSDSPKASYIWENCRYWFEHNLNAFGLNGFHNWDVVAAAYLAEPVNFQDNWQQLQPNQQDLEIGVLTYARKNGVTAIINLPAIKDMPAFTNDVYSAWLSWE